MKCLQCALQLMLIISLVEEGEREIVKPNSLHLCIAARQVAPLGGL